MPDERYFLFDAGQLSGPLPWEDVARFVFSSQRQQTAMVAAEGSQQWESFSIVAQRLAPPALPPPPPPPPPPLTPAEADAMLFCDAAARMGLVTDVQSQAALEGFRRDQAAGCPRPIRYYFEQAGVMTAEQVAAVLGARLSGGATGAIPAGTVMLSASPFRDLHVAAQPQPFGAPRLYSEVVSLDFASLFPFAALFRERMWRFRWAQWLTLLVILPPVFAAIASVAGLAAVPLWGLYFALIWGFVLGSVLLERKQSALLLLAILGYTLIIGTGAAVLLQMLVSWEKDQKSPVAFVLVVLLAGPIAEATKVAPLFWQFIFERHPTTPHAALRLGALSGLAYSVADGLAYAIRAYAAQPQSAPAASQSPPLLDPLMFLATPLLHAMWSGILAFFIGYAAADRRRNPVRAVLLGFLLTSFLNCFYVALATSWIGLLPAGLTALIFAVYARAASAVGPQPAATTLGTTERTPAIP